MTTHDIALITNRFSDPRRLLTMAKLLGLAAAGFVLVWLGAAAAVYVVATVFEIPAWVGIFTA